MASLVNVHCRPGEGGEITIWRSGITNADTVVTLTIDPALAGASAVAFTDASGDDQGRIDISIPTSAAAGAYVWSAEIDSVEVFSGVIYVMPHGRPASFAAHSVDIRSLTSPAWLISRPEDVAGEALGGGPATQIDETSGPTTLDIDAIADGEYLRRVGTEVVGATPGGAGDVTAAANFGTDNLLVRSDGITKGVQASTATLSDAGALSGITSLTLTDNIVMSASKTVDGRDISVDGSTLDTLNSTAVVAAATFATDNRVLRSDGTGRGAQASTISVTDGGVVSGVDDLTLTGSITMSASETVDGRDVSVDGAALDSHIANTSNPHSVTLAQVGGAPAKTIIQLTDTFSTGSTTPVAIAPSSGPTWAAVAVTAGKRYRLDVRVLHQCTATTSIIRLGLNFTNAPADLTARVTIGHTTASNGAWGEQPQFTNNSMTLNSTNVATADLTQYACIDAVFTAHASGGTFEVLARTRVDTASEIVRVMSGSMLILEQLD